MKPFPGVMPMLLAMGTSNWSDPSTMLVAGRQPVQPDPAKVSAAEVRALCVFIDQWNCCISSLKRACNSSMPRRGTSAGDDMLGWKRQL